MGPGGYSVRQDNISILAAISLIWLLSLAVLRCYGHTLSETYEGFRREGGSTGCFSANISGISEDVVIASCDLTKCWKTLQSSSELPVTVIPV